MRMLFWTATLVCMLSATDAAAQRTITGYDFSATGAHQVRLGRMLREISGLTVNARGQLLAHDDEKGVVYRIDAMTGSRLARFRLGRTTVTEDFEDIAAMGDTLILVTSDGRFFLFPEGRDGDRVEYRVVVTPLTATNDVEGLCYDPASGTLLLACKGSPGRGYTDKRAVYSYSLAERRLHTPPRFLVDETALRGKIAGKTFRPSAIAVHPIRHTYFILAARGRGIVELDQRGRVLAVQELDASRHPQPEGLTFMPNGDMIIADEGKKEGLLTRYAYTHRK
ncbi:MAG: SdiA-regulated domain-containing protein [Bacteroidota bacterium]|nr:SdiA-regulated domain-containing protein [Bacteroidota bacterium]